MPGGRSSGPQPATPAPEAPAGEGGESREAKPLWKLRLVRSRYWRPLHVKQDNFSAPPLWLRVPKPNYPYFL